MNTTRITTEIKDAREIFVFDAAMTLKSGLLPDTFPSDAYARVDRIITDIREAGLEPSAESIAEAISLHMRERESVRAMIGLEMTGEDIPLRQRIEKIRMYVSAGRVLTDRLDSALERLVERYQSEPVDANINGAASGQVVIVWSPWVWPKDAAKACGCDKRTLLKDSKVAHYKKPDGRKYKFNIEAIAEYYGEDAAARINGEQ